MKSPKPSAMRRLLRLPSNRYRNPLRTVRLATCSHSTTSTNSSTRPSWNEDDSLFSFTRGRFVFDEEHQMAQRTVRFNMDELARVGAKAIGAPSHRCVHVQKCPDGLYNKAYIFRMDDGREVIGKVPNPNAGLPHYTTASEVATMDFMRNNLLTPTPRVLAWDSRRDNAVGAEYIIMEKAEGVPLGRVWDRMGGADKAKFLLQVFRFMKAWLANPLPGYGGLYYADDVSGDLSLPVSVVGTGAHHDVSSKQFVIGPAVGRDWCDAGRLGLECDRGPWASALDYRRALGAREQAAIQHLPEHTKQMVMLTGPRLYQPSPSKKLWAIDAYLQVLQHILPTKSDPELLPARLWHDDLHTANIFVHPSNPTQITAIIDWQSTQAAPLFDHHPDPAFLDYSGPDIGDNLEKPGPPNTTGLSADEKATAIAQHLDRALVIAWRRLVRGKSPVQYRALKFQDSTAGNILHVARRAYEVGEAHLAALVLDLRDTWQQQQQPESGLGFPVVISAEEEERIKRDVDGAEQGAGLLTQAREQMGEQWPEKGLVEHEAYEETKGLLGYVRDEIAQQCFDDEEERKEFLRRWPFDT